MLIEITGIMATDAEDAVRIARGVLKTDWRVLFVGMDGGAFASPDSYKVRFDVPEGMVVRQTSPVAIGCPWCGKEFDLGPPKSVHLHECKEFEGHDPPTVTYTRDHMTIIWSSPLGGTEHQSIPPSLTPTPGPL